MKNILEYKSLKVEADRLKISEVLIRELLKFNFEEDYLKEGDLQIENASEITFNSCVIENYTETRSISESNRPNRSGVPQGSKRISEFNVWDYKLSFDKEFQNSTDNHDIFESHHAIGCGTCKQQGKIRCSSCRGAGDVTCSSCNGRGEKQCGNCNGRVDIKCWSCSGKGTKETGYGENKRTERCSSCSGRGSNKCTRCSNGFITCSTCSGSGKVTCYTCHGSGEVTCYQCDGNRTMDHFFIVSASFINLSQTLYLTNPYPGFDQNKSKKTNFNVQSKLFDIKEPRFKESHFNDIKSSPFYRQITSFLDFTNNERTKLIASRITCFENKYFEVTFNFYGEKYTLFLDKNFENSYYNGKKPSDQYELDLLKKSIDTTVKNELSVTKKTIQKLSKYDFISISEKEIISCIEDTENIYIAFDDYKIKKYTSAEKTLRLVSEIKKSEDDYGLLRKKLNRVYFVNTLVYWFIGLSVILYIYYTLKDKLFELISLNIDIEIYKHVEIFNFFNFSIANIFIVIGILFICILFNKKLKNIHFARYIVLLFLSAYSFFLHSYVVQKYKQASEEYDENLKPFKEVIYPKFYELGYTVTNISLQSKSTGSDFLVQYKNSDSLNNGYQYNVKVEAFLNGQIFIDNEIKDLRGNEDSRKAKILKYINTEKENVLYIKLLSSNPKFKYEVPETFISNQSGERLYRIWEITIGNGEIYNAFPLLISKAKYDQLEKQYFD